MCIAIANLQNKPMTKQQVENCWTNNKDGAGILYVEDGIMKVYKNITSLKKFTKKYFKVIRNSNCLVHFRISTAGGINIKNCHPFQINDSLGYIHNGMISGWGSKVQGQSDTYSYNEFVLKQLPSNFLDYPAIVKLIQEDIGTYNKFVFMDEEGKFTIINESKGEYDEAGNWYSNDSYKRENDYYWAGNEKIWKPGKEPKQITNKYSYQTGWEWERALREGTIVHSPSKGYTTKDGRKVSRTWNMRNNWTWNKELGCYVEPAALIEFPNPPDEDEDPEIYDMDEICELDEEVLDDPSDEDADIEWLQAQLESMTTYEEEICSVFDQIPQDCFDDIRTWADVDRLGHIPIQYLDVELMSEITMDCNVAIRLILNKYNKPYKTLATVFTEYIELLK